MTAIIGLVHRGKAYLGGDSAFTCDGGSQVILADPKVFALGGYLVGVAGEGPWCDALVWLSWPQAVSDTWLRRDMPRLHRAAMRGGEDSPAPSGEAVIAARGRLWHYEDTVVTLDDPYVCAGMGSTVAQGALFASRGDPGKRIRTALEAAAKYCSAVRPPFTVITEKGTRK